MSLGCGIVFFEYYFDSIYIHRNIAIEWDLQKQKYSRKSKTGLHR